MRLLDLTPAEHNGSTTTVYPAFRAAIDATFHQLGMTHRDRIMVLTHRFETFETASDVAA